MCKKLFKTDFLFYKTNFWTGMGSVLNLSGSYFDFNYSDTEEEADFLAFLNDFGVVGQDMEYALNEFRKLNPSHKKSSSYAMAE